MNAVKTIAVGFDGSPDAEAAVRWALGLASTIGSDVVLVHAVGLLAHLDRENVANDLEVAMRRLTEECGFDPRRVRWHVADGDACSVLVRAAQAPVAADLLVVGSRGRGAHAGLLLGSTSHELAEHATVPLVIVPTGRNANE
jgi:nucleotide-binding universal stress UspA family protein